MTHPNPSPSSLLPPVQPPKALSSTAAKGLILGALTIVLMIPLTLVDTQIESRSGYEREAAEAIRKGWGGEVKASTPYVTGARFRSRIPRAAILVALQASEKKRGNFRVPVYTGEIRYEAVLPKLATQPLAKPEKGQVWDAKKATEDARLSVAFSQNELASIQGFELKVDGVREVPEARVHSGAIYVDIPYGQEAQWSEKKIHAVVRVRGSGAFNYDSYAKNESVSIRGDWPKPKFSDSFLPRSTSVEPGGYTADWEFESLAGWTGEGTPKPIGVEHLWVGNDYARIKRASDYGMLFIVLTFTLMFLIEFVGKFRVHPIQYGLVGLGICVFYLLLLSFSELVGFSWSYVIGSLAVTALITAYGAGFLKQRRFVVAMAVEQTVLSAFYYLLLTLEEGSLVIGSVGVFLALAAFMIVTRKFDWYAGSFQTEGSETSAK